MPINLDSCITGVFTPGNIGASSGLPPVAPVYIARPGNVMYEAASASDTVTAGGNAYTVAIAEAASVADTPSANVVTAASVVETGAATSTQAVPYAILDSGTVVAVTLSGGDLVATNTGTTSANQGAKVATATARTVGKYYFEVTLTTLTGGNNTGVGVGQPASTFSNMGATATTGNMMFRSGNIWASGSNTSISLGARSAGNVIGLAVDLDNRRIWFRVAPAGNWNNNVSNDPATNVGGIVVPASTIVPFVTFGGTGGVASNVLTLNFGASAFTGAVPSGFTSGWV